MSVDATTAVKAPAVVGIDVISDVMCPWCFIGKRRLEHAAQMLAGEVDLAVVWQPYQLDASLPAEGLDRKTYLEAKFGGPDQAAETYARIGEAGAGEGIDFNFDAIAVSPNTLDAHRLIHWAGQQSPAVQGAVVEQLFTRFFLHGEHIGRHDVLVEAAEEAGMAIDGLTEKLAGEQDRDAIAGQAAHAGRIGVTGVPCFIIDRRLAVSGAHAPETLVMAIRQALGERQPN